MTPSEYKAALRNADIYKKFSDLEKKKFDAIKAQATQDYLSKLEAGEEITFDSAWTAAVEDIEKITATPVTTEFKPFEEKTVKRAAPPLTLPAMPGDEPTLKTAIAPQQVIPSPRADITRPYKVDFKKVAQSLEASGLSAQDAQIQSTALQEALLELQQIDKKATPEEAFKSTLKEIENITKAPTLKEDKVGSKDPYIRAFSQQIKEGEIPDYSPVQLAFLKSVNKQRVENYVEKNLPDIKKTVNRYRAINIEGDRKLLIPDEVYQYMKTTTLPPTIYNERIDKLILEGDADFTTQLNPRESDKDYQALAKVKGFQELGGGEWFLDEAKKKRVLENPEKFEKGLVIPGLGETEGGWIFEKTTPLGGTAESTGAWVLRSMLSPLNLVAGVVTDVTSTDELKRLKEAQRAKKEPLYKDSPVLSNIALNKGFTGEAQDAADALRVEDPYARFALVGAGFAADILDPSMAIAAGTGKALKAGAKLRSAQKAIYGTTNKKQIASTMKRTFTGEVLDDFNAISLTNKLVPEKYAFKGLEHGDIRLHLADDFAQSLDAKRIVEAAPDQAAALRQLEEVGLRETTYSKALDEQLIKEDFDTAKLRLKEQLAPSDEVKSLLKELDDSQRYLDDVAQFGKSKAAARADDLGYKIKPRVIEDTLRAAGDDVTKAKKLLDQQYARAVVFEQTPNLQSLENMIAITRNTWSHKSKVPDILASSLESPLGRELSSIANVSKVGKDVKPAQSSLGIAYQRGKVTKEGVPTNFFKITEEQQDALKPLLQELNLPPSQKSFIAASIDEGKLYLDDYRLLIDTNIDNTARALQSDIATREDISRLPAREQKKLLEAEGTQERAFGGFDVLKDLYSAASKKILKNNTTPSIPQTMKDTSVELRVLVKEIQQEASTLDTKAKREINGLLKSAEQRALYVQDPDINISRMEALGVITVGARQDARGLARQKQILDEVFRWSFDRLFYDSKSYENIIDNVIGAQKLYDNNILNQAGKRMLRKESLDLASQVIDSPRDFWRLYEQFIEGWKVKLDTGVVDGERIVNVNVKPKTIKAAELEKVKGEIGLGLFYNAETARIKDKKLLNVINKEFTPTTTTAIFPGKNIDDKVFQDAVKEAVLLGHNRIVPYSYIYDNLLDIGLEPDVARKAIEYAEVITRKNGLSDYTHLDLAGMKSLLDDLFNGSNKKFAAAIVGEEYYSQINRALTEGRASSLTKDLDTFLRSVSATPKGFLAVKKFFNQMNSFRYTVLLAMRPRFHGANVLTANAIMYSTIGKVIGASATKKGFDVAFFASSPGARKVNEIAVRAPGGAVYTYGDIYEAVRRSGVRSEFSFMTSAVNDDAFLSWLKRAGGKGEGISKRVIDFIKDAPSNLNDLTVTEDLVFRAGAMIKALEEGRSIEEATQLARRSLFDYNDMFPAEKALASYFFIFYSFNRQNFTTLLKSLLKTKKLNRYMNVLKFDRGVEALAAELNGGKRFPHQAFFPEYTMFRTVLDVQKGQEKDWYLATPPIPAIDAILLATQIASEGISAVTQKQLAPQFKRLLGLESEFGRAKRIPSEYVNIIKNTYSEDPNEIASLLQVVVGGQVIPTPTGEEKGGVSGITKEGKETFYTYQLNAAQQKRWNVFSKYALDYLFLGTPAKDYSKFFATEGTSSQKLGEIGKLTSLIGFTTPFGMQKTESFDLFQLIKREEELENRIKELRRIQRGGKEQKIEKSLDTSTPPPPPENNNDLNIIDL